MPEMTLKQKIYQMLMPAFKTWDPSSSDGMSFWTMAQKLGERHFGGVVVFPKNMVEPNQTSMFLKMVNKANQDTGGYADYFFAIDQEGGRVSALTGGTKFAGNMALGAANDESLVLETVGVMGAELSDVGFNLDFAPDVDVNDNPANPVIGVRSFSDDPDTVSRLGRSFIEALHENGIMAVAKHFPGHGNTVVDSHVGLPMVEKTLEELEKTEFVPFRAVADSADMIMTAHIQFPQIEKETYISKETGKKIFLPATLSKTIITGLLRENMGYDGVVVTDSMVMGAISKHFDPLDAARLAINAGADIILMPVDLSTANDFDEIDRYVDAIMSMVEKGEIPESRIDESVGRILALKEKYKQTAKPAGMIDWRSHIPFAWRSAFKAVTLLQNRNNLMPLSGKERTLVCCPSEPALQAVEEALAFMVRSNIIPENHSIEVCIYDKPYVLPCGYEAYVLISENGCDVKVPNDLADKVVFISAALPYDTATATSYGAVLACYGYEGSLNLTVCLSAVFGTFMPKGRLPVTIPSPDGTIAWERGFRA